jgi:Family of unknown function (DUF6111)
MFRNLVEEILLFVLPFALFASWLLITKRNPLDIAHWSGWKFGLTVAGIMLGIASIVLTGLTADRHTGAYIPSRMEDGKLVPGRFNDPP